HASRLLEEEVRRGTVRELLESEALRTARDVERELNRGRTRGLLQGAPFAVSETIAVAGRPAPWNPEINDLRRHEDAAVVERLRRARALLLAVAVSPPIGGVTEGPAAVETACASLVARRLAPFALAADFNGNVLRAALEQGCCALRPTFSLTSGYGVAPLGWTLATAAVLATNAADCGTVLASMSGGDLRSPSSPGRAFRFAPQYAPRPEQMRVALTPGGDLLRAWLTRARVTLVDLPAVDLPPWDVLETILAAEAGEAFADLLEALPAGREFLSEARSLTAFDYLHAMRLRRKIQEWLSAVFEMADILVLSWDPRHAHSTQALVENGGDCRTCDMLAAAVLAGAPVFASGCNGRPRFCMIVRPWSENTMLRLAASLDSISPGAPTGQV
ncbi:MAG: amidase family protein, partial [Bryobacteraceae bacterium]